MNEYCLHFRRGATVYLLIALACLGSASCEALKPLGCNMVAFISALHFLLQHLRKGWCMLKQTGATFHSPSSCVARSRYLAICLLGLQVVLSSLKASGETLTLETDFPFVIILVILAVNHSSVLYLLCFSTVVIKSKPECHPELH